MSSSDKPDVLHVYDGIEEMDNHMPNWWLLILWSSIVFGFGYWYYYQVSHMGPSSLEVHAAELAEQSRLAASRPLSEATLIAMSKDARSVEAGQAVFQQQCMACHGAQGQGLIGPNLTDNAWIHGPKAMDMHAIVSQGVAAKGMPAWERVLGPERVRSVVAYILTIKNTNVPGKPPQGEPAP